MAQFNNEIIADDEKIRKNAMQECGMYLQSCLTKEELDKLKEDWKKAGGYEVIPWWKFAFDNIKVSYSSEAREYVYLIEATSLYSGSHRITHESYFSYEKAKDFITRKLAINNLKKIDKYNWISDDMKYSIIPLSIK